MASEQQKAAERAAERAEQKAAERSEQAQEQGARDQQAARESADQPDVTKDGDVVVGADASQSAQPAPVVGAVSGAPFADKVTGSVDPRTGDEFKPDGGGDRFKGISQSPSVDDAGLFVAGVDPDRIPAETLPGHTPDAQGDKLLAAAQAKAPSLTREMVDGLELNDTQLAQIARGDIPGPPTPGPLHSNDLYVTPGGYQLTPPGVPPEDVGKNAVSR